MNCHNYMCKALVGFFLSLALGAFAVTDAGDASPAVGTDPDPAKATTAANPTIPSLAAIKVYFKLDPHLAPEWLAANSAVLSVSPTRSNSVTVSMQRPGESTLNVTHGEVSETLTL